MKHKMILEVTDTNIQKSIDQKIMGLTTQYLREVVESTIAEKYESILKAKLTDENIEKRIRSRINEQLVYGYTGNLKDTVLKILQETANKAFVQGLQEELKSDLKVIMEPYIKRLIIEVVKTEVKEFIKQEASKEINEAIKEIVAKLILGGQK